MFKKYIKISLAFIVILFVGWFISNTSVNAAGNTWYEEAAARTDNPVLLSDEEYYQGISLDSNPISDLTFLEIPFGKFYYGSEKEIQIITFSEAIWKSGNEIKNTVVMYLYEPYYQSTKSVAVKINYLSQQVLINDNMVDQTIDDKYDKFQFVIEESYGTIYKMTVEQHLTSEDDRFSGLLSSKLLKSYNSENQITRTSTIFNAEILELNSKRYDSGYYSEKLREELLNENKLMSTQEFNFIYEKTVEHPEAVALLSDEVETEKIHKLTSIGYNETKAKVEGSIFRLRFDNEDLSGGKINLLLSTDGFIENQDGHTDFFYYFFNVSDSTTGSKWTGKEAITAIEYTYYDYITEYATKYSGIIIGIESKSAATRVTYLKSNGGIYAQDTKDFDLDSYNDFVNSEKYNGETIFDMMSYRDSSSLTEIYKKKRIEPGTFEHKYPVKKDSVSILEWLRGATNDIYKTSLPYVFSTSDTQFVNEVSFNLTSDIKTSDFQYGMLVGEPGYPAITRAEASSIIIATSGTTYALQYGVELIELNDIWYEYEGEKYHAVVEETIVDNSNINKPVDPTGSSNGSKPQTPLFPTELVPEDPADMSWWEKLLYYLEMLLEGGEDNVLKKFFDGIAEFLEKAENVLITIAIVTVITAGIVFLIKLIKRIRNNTQGENDERNN